MTMIFRMIKSRILLILAAASFVYVLGLDYQLVESRIYTENLFYRPPPLPYLLLSYALAIAPALWMPISIRSPSQVIYWILYVVVIVPSMFVPYHVLPRLPPSQIAFLPLVLFGAFAVLGCSYRFRPISVPKHRISPLGFKVSLIGGLVATAVVLTAFHGFRFDVPLSDPYTRRIEARTTLAGGSPLGYLSTMFQKFLIPFSIAYGIGRRVPFLLVVGVAVTLPAFVLDGQKTVLALPIYMLFMTVLLTRYRRRFGAALLATCSVLLLGSMAEYLLLGSSTLSGLVSRRLFTVPAQLTSYYWEWFSTNPQQHLASGIVGSFAGSSEVMTSAQTIGMRYFGSSAVNANANIWASAFSEFGLLGIIVVTIMVGSLMRLIDGMVTAHNFLAGALISAFIGIAWAEGAFQTSLLSVGVLPALVGLFLLPARPERRAPLRPFRALRGRTVRHPTPLAPVYAQTTNVRSAPARPTLG
jgi:hypothetical protein